MYYVKNLEAPLSGDWNFVLERSDETGLFHELTMLDFLARERDAENISFILYNSNNEPVGICPLYYYSFKNVFRMKVTALNSFGSTGAGPALVRGFNEKTRRQIYEFLSVHFHKLIQQYRCDIFFTSAAILSKRYTETEIPFVNPLLELRGFTDASHPYYYLDLRRSAEDLTAGIEKRTRLILKKFSSDSGFSIRKATPDDAETAWDLCVQTYRRNNEPLIKKELYMDYYNLPYARIFIAFQGNEPAAAINCGIYKNTGLYWMMDTGNEFVSSGIGAYMLWHSILDAKSDGVDHFYLGPELYWKKGSKEDNIARYKRSFGGQLRYRFMVKYERESSHIRLLRHLKNLKDQLVSQREGT